MYLKKRRHLGTLKLHFKISTYFDMEGAERGRKIYLISKLRKFSRCSISRLLDAVILENNCS